MDNATEESGSAALSNSVEQMRIDNSASPAAEVRALLTALRAHSTSLQPKPLLRSTPFQVTSSSANDRTYTLHSWKTLEHAYRKVSVVGLGALDDMPSLARGLFTVDADGEKDEEERIVVRGYDKFFSVGELPWTKPQALAQYTTGPYVVTWKENGCIIFISALDAHTLVVCSKHSTGEREEGVRSHAQVGEVWLERHLAKRGRTREELARELWRRGETAVAELCDDSFEEHVLAYAPERSGLYLHGLNANSVTFRTRPIEQVAAFAADWGFLPPRWRTFDTLDELNSFSAQVAKTGAWEGEALEGFVVRTHMPSTEQLAAASANGQGSKVQSPPYQAGQAWFFKIKFDYPYLMYREWRELTRRMLADQAKWKEEGAAKQAAAEAETAEAQAARGETAETQEKPARVSAEAETTVASAAAVQEESVVDAAEPTEELSKNKLKQLRKAEERANGPKGGKGGPPKPPTAKAATPETRLYIDFVYVRLWGKPSEQIAPQPALFEGFAQGKGMIALRERFLIWLGSAEGQRRLANMGGATPAVAPKQRSQAPFTHTLLVPIAVPGCGKTTLSIALKHLFSGDTCSVQHVQSDDVLTKKSGPTFLKNVEEALQVHRVVIADRNNHLLQHRAEVIARTETFERAHSASAGKKSKGKSKVKNASVVEEAPPQPAQVQATHVRLVALAWHLDAQPLNKLHRICSERIVRRGANHQSLRADLGKGAGTRTHEVALWRFLEKMRAFDPLAEGETDERFDEVVALDVEGSEIENLEKAAREVARILDVPCPGAEELTKALQVAHAYKVARKKADEETHDADLQKAPRYYGLAVELDSEALLHALFVKHAEKEGKMEEAARAWNILRLGERLIRGPHVTLVHRKELPDAERIKLESADVKLSAKKEEEGAAEEEGAKNETTTDETSAETTAPPSAPEEAPSPPTPAQLEALTRWTHYASLSHSATASPPRHALHVDRLAWNKRCMTLGISRTSLAELRELQPVHWVPHITLGTANDEVRPYEAAGVLRAADALIRGEEKEQVEEEDGGEVKWIILPHGGIECEGVLQGMYR